MEQDNDFDFDFDFRKSCGNHNRKAKAKGKGMSKGKDRDKGKRNGKNNREEPQDSDAAATNTTRCWPYSDRRAVQIILAERQYRYAGKGELVRQGPQTWPAVLNTILNKTATPDNYNIGGVPPREPHAHSRHKGCTFHPKVTMYTQDAWSCWQTQYMSSIKECAYSCAACNPGLARPSLCRIVCEGACVPATRIDFQHANSCTIEYYQNLPDLDNYWQINMFTNYKTTDWLTRPNVNHNKYVKEQHAAITHNDQVLLNAYKVPRSWRFGWADCDDEKEHNPFITEEGIRQQKLWRLTMQTKLRRPKYGEFMHAFPRKKRVVKARQYSRASSVMHELLLQEQDFLLC